MHMDRPAVPAHPRAMCRCQRTQSTAPQATNGAAPAGRYHVKSRLYYRGTETPVNQARWEIVDEEGLVARTGTTAEDGLVLEEVEHGGRYTLRVVEFPPMPEEDT